MADIDWVRVAVTGAITIAFIYYGRWTQRRDDRKAAERDLAEVGRRFYAWRNRDRGGNQ
jgi:hypothetical protein